MTDAQGENLPVPIEGGKLIKSSNQLAKVRESQDLSADYVPHLDFPQLLRLVHAVRKNRNGERDCLIIQTLFDGCFRVSEVISIRPQDLVLKEGGWQVNILGKGGKRSTVAISPSLVAQLQAYAYRQQIPPEGRIFPINRSRVFQIVSKAMKDAGVTKPDGVGSVHVLRHSGALERLKETGNPKAVQEQLRHRSAKMTLRYMKTLSHDESIKINQGVDYKW